jgi:type II secretory pathway pseudopilin PulG
MHGLVRRSTTGLAAAVVVVVMALALPGAARADNAAEMKARADFAAGHYDRALDAFAALYAQTLNPIYLRNIGRCHQKLREPDKAIDSFREYLGKAKKISAEERAEIDGYIKEMEELRADQAQAAKPAEPTPPPTPPVVAPVQPIAPAPPAADSSLGRAPGVETPLPTDKTAATTTLVAQPAPPPRASSPFYARWWFWTIVGAAVLGGVATAFALGGGTTKPPCSSSDVNVLVCK